MTPVRLAKLSVCPCGFPLMHESVPLGTEYACEMSDRIHCEFTCGGCKKQYQFEAVWIYSRDSHHGGYAPAVAFEPT